MKRNKKGNRRLKRSEFILRARRAFNANAKKLDACTTYIAPVRGAKRVNEHTLYVENSV